jgi:hypothetical protein
MGIELISRDNAYIEFLKEFDPTETDDPSSSAASDPAQTAQEHSEGHESDDPPAPSAQEFVITACLACGVKNKVRSERLIQGFKCGRCGAPLSPQA